MDFTQRVLTAYARIEDRRLRSIIEALISRKQVTDPSNLEHDYLAYFGRYEIDTGREVVRHMVEGELFPGGHSEILERRYRFEGDLMSLKPVDGTDREILWQRVPNR